MASHPAEIARRRDERLARMVAWAAASIPFHRSRFADLAAEVHGVADLPRLPTMTRQDIRDNFPARLLPDGVDFAELLANGEAEVQASSGTSGERLQVLFDQKRWTSPMSLPEYRAAGGARALRIAVFTTPICSGAICHMGGSSYEARLRDRQLVLNSSDRVMHLTRPELDNIVEELDRFQPTILQVDPFYGVALVRALAREGLPLPRVAAVRTSYEYCSVIHRDLLARTLGAPVYTVYGATELGGGTAAFRCEEGRFHVWDDSYVFEFLDGERPVEPGEVGALVVTALDNRFMPMVRYRIGDLGRPIADACRCAHAAWPSFVLEGRQVDCLRDGAGGRVTTRAVDELFRDLRWLDFYQLMEHAAGDYELLALRGPDGDDQEEAVWLDRARALLGATARLRVRYLRELPPQRSLKYQLTRPSLE